MKSFFDQIAIGVCRPEHMEETIKRAQEAFDCRFDARDHVTAVGRDHMGNRISNSADLAFTYELWPGGLEHEVLCYRAGFNWHTITPEAFTHRPFISHFGKHVATRGEMDSLSRGWAVLQEVVTIGHTNDHIATTRRYHYRILDTRSWLGAEMKLIRRLTLAEGELLREELVG